MTQDEASLAEFHAGLIDPFEEDDAASDPNGIRVTTLRSRWIGAVCPVTHHTFRIGDEVCDEKETGTVRHTNPLLLCDLNAGADDEIAAVQHDFYHGLAETWPPPKGIPVVRLRPGHALLAPPPAGSKIRRHMCGVCGHTFRVNDQVLICPCQPHQLTCATDLIEVPGMAPRAPCWFAIHRDPLHGLHCWEAWNPGDTLTHCPVTSRKLDV